MKERFEALRQALIAERECELAAYRSLLEERSMKERIAEGATLYPIEFTGFRYNQFDDLILDFNINADQNARLFAANGRCHLFNANEPAEEEGIITLSRNNRLSLVLFSNELPGWIKSGKLGLNAVCDTRSYDIQLKTVDRLADSQRGPAFDFYHRSAKPYSGKNDHPDEELNPSQLKAVAAILAGNSVHIVHGPPGTGKTKTLVAAIGRLVAEGRRVLVAAPTNAAADHITYELSLKKLPVLRYGSSFKIHEKVEPLTLKSRVLNHPDMAVVNRLGKEAEAIRKKADRFVRNFGKEEQEERRALRRELKMLQRDMKAIEQQIEQAMLDNAAVICGTLIGLQHEEILRIKFDTVVVDEAAQALEPAVWSVGTLAEQLVMAGDPMQLPPTLYSREAEKLGLSVSLVEKGIELGHPTTLLDTQYRMNDVIMQFSNRKFYENRLHSDPSVASRRLDTDPHEPIEFIDTAGCGYDEEPDETGGISNPGEAMVVNSRLKELPAGNYSLAIIAPYRRQVMHLQDCLPELVTNIQTVDSFQGQERDVVLISLTRSNTAGEIGFLKDYRRMNVAMTRAKRKLIIVGDSATLGNDQFYADLLSYIETSGTYRSAWEFASE